MTDHICFECHKYRTAVGSHLCAAFECAEFVCTACWESHKTWHRLQGGSDVAIFLPAYLQAKDREVLFLLGRRAKDS
jgi:hypothetical protein